MKVPLLNFVGGPGVPLLNFEEDPGVPLLLFRGLPGHAFKLSGESRISGLRLTKARVPKCWSHCYTMPVTLFETEVAFTWV